MTRSFAAILDQELNATGFESSGQEIVPLASCCPSSTGSGSTSLPANRYPADKTNLSCRSRQLSLSLRELGNDIRRLRQRKSGIIAGNANTGYIRETEEGLAGCMAFATTSGATIAICLDSSSAERQLFISVEKNGQTFQFDIEEIAGVISGPAPDVYPALPCSGQSAQPAGTASVPPPCISYDAHAAPVRCSAHAVQTMFII